jgi:hypothetical protein
MPGCSARRHASDRSAALVWNYFLLASYLCVFSDRPHCGSPFNYSFFTRAPLARNCARAKTPTPEQFREDFATEESP